MKESEQSVLEKQREAVDEGTPDVDYQTSGVELLEQLKPQITETDGVSMEAQEDMLAELCRTPRRFAGRPDLANALDCSGPTIRRAGNALRGDGLIRDDRVGETTVYYLDTPHSDHPVPDDVTPLSATDPDVVQANDMDALTMVDGRATRSIVSSGAYLAIWLFAVGVVWQVTDPGPLVVVENGWWSASIHVLVVSALMLGSYRFAKWVDRFRDD